MKLGRRYDPQEIVFSLEKPSPSSSSSSSFVGPSSSSSSSASSSSSSSTSAGCGPFNFTLNTTLGSNLDFPGQYFGGAVGVSIICPGAEVVLKYDNLDIAGPSFIMDIQIGGQIIAAATVAIGLDTRLYIGKPFSLTYLDTTYCGVFASGTVILG